MKKTIFLLTIICLQNCGIIKDRNNSQYQEIPSTKSSKKLTYEKDNYKMWWGDSITYINKQYDITYQNETSYFVAKNGNEDRLVAFQLDTPKTAFDLSDKLSFPMDLGEVASVYVHNFDSIFVAQTYQITLLDSSGKVKFQIPINDGDSKYALGNLHGGSPVFYDNKTESLYFQTYCWRCPQHKSSHYTSHISSQFNLKTKQITPLPITYPILYQEAYYGFNNHVFSTYTDSLNVYTFPMTPNIYVYNRYTESYKILGGKSKYQQQLPLALSPRQKNNDKAKMEHRSRAPFYYKVHYNPFQNYYYRFFSPILPEKNEDGLFTRNGDRKHILMIFDEQFRLVDEIELDEVHQVFYTFCTPEGLYVNRVNKQKEAGLYTVFKINIQ